MDLSLWYKACHGMFLCIFISGHNVLIISGFPSLRPEQVIRICYISQGIALHQALLVPSLKLFFGGLGLPMGSSIT